MDFSKSWTLERRRTCRTEDYCIGVDVGVVKFGLHDMLLDDCDHRGRALGRSKVHKKYKGAGLTVLLLIPRRLFAYRARRVRVLAGDGERHDHGQGLGGVTSVVRRKDAPTKYLYGVEPRALLGPLGTFHQCQRAAADGLHLEFLYREAVGSGARYTARPCAEGATGFARCGSIEA